METYLQVANFAFVICEDGHLWVMECCIEWYSINHEIKSSGCLWIEDDYLLENIIAITPKVIKGEYCRVANDLPKLTEIIGYNAHLVLLKTYCGQCVLISKTFPSGTYFNLETPAKQVIWAGDNIFILDFAGNVGKFSICTNQTEIQICTNGTHIASDILMIHQHNNKLIVVDKEGVIKYNNLCAVKKYLDISCFSCDYFVVGSKVYCINFDISVEELKIEHITTCLDSVSTGESLFRNKIPILDMYIYCGINIIDIYGNFWRGAPNLTKFDTPFKCKRFVAKNYADLYIECENGNIYNIKRFVYETLDPFVILRQKNMPFRLSDDKQKVIFVKSAASIGR